MIEAGHTSVDLYTLGQMWDETSLIVARRNGEIATQATLLKAAIDTAVAAFGKKGAARKAANEFRKLIEELTDGE